MPEFAIMTEGNVSDVTVAKSDLPITLGSIYCFDRAYTDLDLQGAYFVTKLKRNMKYKITGQHTERKSKIMLSDEKIKLNNKKYNSVLRLIRFYDDESGEILKFITNNFNLAPKTIVQIYKTRWQIEIFFRWIKQNLKIKSFLGTSKNAVLTQVWIAIIYYLLLTYIKYQIKFKSSLLSLHRIVREALMAKLTIVDLLRVTPARISRFKISEFQHNFW